MISAGNMASFQILETSNELTIFYGDFAELDASGAVKEGGITSRSTLSVESLKMMQ